jgi:hypothetical protein
MLSSELRDMGVAYAKEIRNKEKEKLVQKIYNGVLCKAGTSINSYIYEYQIEDTIIETVEEYERCIKRYQTNINFDPSDIVHNNFGIIRGTLSKDFIQDVVSDLQKLFPDSSITHIYMFKRYKKGTLEDWKTVCVLFHSDDKGFFDQVIKDNMDDDILLSIERYIRIDWSEAKL